MRRWEICETKKRRKEICNMCGITWVGRARVGWQTCPSKLVRCTLVGITKCFWGSCRTPEATTSCASFPVVCHEIMFPAKMTVVTSCSNAASAAELKLPLLFIKHIHSTPFENVRSNAAVAARKKTYRSLNAREDSFESSYPRAQHHSPGNNTTNYVHHKNVLTICQMSPTELKSTHSVCVYVVIYNPRAHTRHFLRRNSLWEKSFCVKGCVIFKITTSSTTTTTPTTTTTTTTTKRRSTTLNIIH